MTTVRVILQRCARGICSNKGRYSANQVLLFCILTLSLWTPFLGPALRHPAVYIRHKSVKNIYLAFVDPLMHTAEQWGIDTVFPLLRESFLHATGLIQHPEWEDTFYHCEQRSYEPAAALAESVPSPVLQEAVAVSPPGVAVNDSVAERKTTAPARVFSRTALRILMCGDSQMRYLTGGALQVLGTSSHVQIQEVTVSSSVFVRTDYYHWPRKFLALLDTHTQQEPYAAVIMAFGMNDYQNFYDADGSLCVTKTARWERAYEQKMRACLNIILHTVPKVYLLGMPETRNKQLNEKLVYIEHVQKKVVAQYDPQRVRYYSLKPIVPGVHGTYASAIRDTHGRWVHVMHKDGIHYTIEGGAYVMETLLPLILADLERSRHGYMRSSLGSHELPATKGMERARHASTRT